MVGFTVDIIIIINFVNFVNSSTSAERRKLTCTSRALHKQLLVELNVAQQRFTFSLRGNEKKLINL